MISENEYKLLKRLVISEFPVWESYKLMEEDKWTGWKPRNIEDVYRCINERFHSLEKDEWGCDHLNLEGWVSSGGFVGGFVNGHIFVSWSFHSVCSKYWLPKDIEAPLTFADVKNYSDLYTEIDCMEFLRMYKIYKLWHKKDKEIITTTETTIFPQG